MALSTAEIVLIAVVAVVVVLLLAHFAYHRMYDPFAKEISEAMASRSQYGDYAGVAA